MLNGAEIEFDNPKEPARWRHHVPLNAVIDEVAAQYPHVDVCDVRPVVNSASQVVDNIRHYRRGVHFHLARRIEQLVAQRRALKTSPVASWLQGAKVVVRDALWKAKRAIVGPSKTLAQKPRARRPPLPPPAHFP